MLEEVLPELKERTDVKQIYTDGGYGSPDLDKPMRRTAMDLSRNRVSGSWLLIMRANIRLSIICDGFHLESDYERY